MSEIKQAELSLYSKASLKTTLRDHRDGNYGLKFGTIEQVCRQYGIKCIEHPSCIEFKAPKSRLSLFMEKLHFGRVSYSKKIL